MIRITTLIVLGVTTHCFSLYGMFLLPKTVQQWLYSQQEESVQTNNVPTISTDQNATRSSQQSAYSQYLAFRLKRVHQSQKPQKPPYQNIIFSAGNGLDAYEVTYHPTLPLCAASAHKDGKSQIYLLDQKKIAIVNRLKASMVGMPNLSFSRNGDLLAYKFLNDTNTYSQLGDTTVVFDQKNQLYTNIPTHNALSLAWSKLSNNLAVTSWHDGASKTDIYDIQENQQYKKLYSVDNTWSAAQWNPQHEVFAAEYLGNNQTQGIKLYDSKQSGKVIATIPTPSIPEFCWGPDGKTLLINTTLYSYMGEKIADLSGVSPEGIIIDDWQGEIIALHTRNSTNALLYNNTAEKIQATLPLKEAVHRVKISAAKQYALTTATYGEMRWWNLDGTTQSYNDWNGYNLNLAISNDGECQSCMRIEFDPSINSMAPNLLSYAYGQNDLPEIINDYKELDK